MNIYKTQHRATCPNGELVDTYSITIKSHSTIMVEEILLALTSSPKTIYQEDLATHLRTALGAEIIVEGWHHGVFVTSTRN